MEGVSRAESETAPAWWRGVRAVERCGRGLEYGHGARWNRACCVDGARRGRSLQRGCGLSWAEPIMGGACCVGGGPSWAEPWCGWSPSWAELLHGPTPQTPPGAGHPRAGPGRGSSWTSACLGPGVWGLVQRQGGGCAGRAWGAGAHHPGCGCAVLGGGWSPPGSAGRGCAL